MDPGTNNPRARLRLDFGAFAPQPAQSSLIPTTPKVLQFSPDQTYEASVNDLEEICIIGQGSFGGTLAKMLHRPTGTVMAVKRIRANDINATERKRMMRELKIIMDSQDCEDIVRFYGAMFHNGDCWICMELLDCSLEDLYQRVYKEGSRLPEHIIGFISVSLIRALNYLKEQLNIIHRDVKPSNMLIDGKGYIKLCDFGISGYLEDSIAKTEDVGCQIYLAPERLSQRGYDIRSDVWSLGISLVEICIGRFPYLGWKTVFDQLAAVVNGDPPILTVDEYKSAELVNFVNTCITKEMNDRPKYVDLMGMPFYAQYNTTDPVEKQRQRSQFAEYVQPYLTLIHESQGAAESK